MTIPSSLRILSLGAALTGLFGLLDSVQGQSTYSPYSRFGLGKLQSGAGAAQMGMGQMGAAWTDRSHLNTINPAAAAFLTRTTFAGGFDVRSERIMEGDSATQGELGGLTQIAFALKRAGGKSAITFGLQPRSQAGYDVSQALVDPVADAYEIRYSGTGGLSQSYIGYARRWEGYAWRKFTDGDGTVTDSSRIITSGTAFGARFEQVFGSMVRTRNIDVANPIYVDTRVQTDETHRSAGFTLGLVREQLISAKFDKDKKLVSSALLRIGGVAQLGRQHTADRMTRWASWQTLSTGPLEVDSVHATSEKYTLDLPLSLALGAEWEYNSRKGARWRIGAEWRKTSWSVLAPDMLDPGVSWRDDVGFSAGASLTPRGLDDARNGFQRATYSIGHSAQSGYILIDAGPVQSSMWSLGWSLPMLGSRSGSSINLALTWQNTSTGSDALLTENGIGAMVGFTLHPFFKNQWLVPRKYD
ncbi:MAG: hypothetical protein L7S63_02585 [Flavobacteriales bacterium]|nr:hypothetical protein [Flavobacteriales bacterium]